MADTDKKTRKVTRDTGKVPGLDLMAVARWALADYYSVE